MALLTSKRYVFAGIAGFIIIIHLIFGTSIYSPNPEAGYGMSFFYGSAPPSDPGIKVLDPDLTAELQPNLSPLLPSSSSSSSSSLYSDDDEEEESESLLNNLSMNHTAVNGNANATFVIVCRNNDIAGVVASIQQVEDRFNRGKGYPWVLLNEEPFTEDFQRRIKILTSAPVHFGLIPSWQWYQPDWIDEKRAELSRKKMARQRIIYGDSVSYRNMCRYNSGFFYKHDLLKQFRYYWRVEPDVKFFCDITYDPFKFMQENNKVYSFTISLKEIGKTIETLWDAVKEFVTDYPEYVANENGMQFLSNDGGKSFNLCHYWSNFEIADLDFWRGEAYEAFFAHLEAKGGFYYERWGDAPVHSIAASLFARKDQVHFFSDIGYQHDDFAHCPRGNEWKRGRCACDPVSSFDYGKDSCLVRFERMFGPEDDRHLKLRTSKAGLNELEEIEARIPNDVKGVAASS